MGNSEIASMWNERGRRMYEDPEYARSILDSDIMSTSTMRSVSKSILEVIRPKTASDYRLRFERISPIQSDRSRGFSSGEFDGDHQFYGLANGLRCDGKFVIIQYDRVLGAPKSISTWDMNLEYPNTRDIVISMDEAVEIARDHIERKLGRGIEYLRVCEFTKLTFPKIGTPEIGEVYDTTQPRIAHYVRLTWRKSGDSGWYLDDATVDAIDGVILDSSHFMATSDGPMDDEYFCEDSVWLP